MTSRHDCLSWSVFVICEESNRLAKGELEDLGEEVDENVENITKMQGQILNLTHGKVNIFEDDGSFKSTYEILKQIYYVWDELTDLEQAEVCLYVQKCA